MKKAFEVKKNAFFIIFKGFSIATYWLVSTPLMVFFLLIQFLYLLKISQYIILLKFMPCIFLRHFGATLLALCSSITVYHYSHKSFMLYQFSRHFFQCFNALSSGPCSGNNSYAANHSSIYFEINHNCWNSAVITFDTFPLFLAQGLKLELWLI